MTISRVGVVGCGLMGGGIAQVVAQSGYATTVVEADQGLLDRGLTGLARSLDGLVDKGRLSAEQRDAARSRLTGTVRVEDLGRFNLERIGGESELLAAQEEIRSRTIREELLAYIAKLIRATRDNLKVEVGASPRAGLMLLTAAKARAALQGRGHVLPDDVKAVAKPVLRHRLMLKPGAEVDGFTTDDVLNEILGRQEIPR